MGQEEFGRWLSLTMHNRNVSGQKLAKAIKVTPGAVSGWTTGKTQPRLDNVTKIAKVFGVPWTRLAVLAGLLTEEETGVKPLPMPEPTEQRKAAKRRIMSIPELTEAQRQFLIDAFDDYTARETS